MSHAFTHALTMLILALVLRAALRASPVAATDGSYLLRYPWLLRLLAALGTLLFGTGSIAVPVLHQLGKLDVNEREFWFMMAGYLAFFLAEALFAIEVFGTNILVTKTGLESSSPWSGRKSLAWDEIVEVRWRPIAEAFAVTGPGGLTIRVPKLISGIRQFCFDLKVCVPMERREAAQPGLDAIDSADELSL